MALAALATRVAGLARAGAGAASRGARAVSRGARRARVVARRKYKKFARTKTGKAVRLFGNLFLNNYLESQGLSGKDFKAGSMEAKAMRKAGLYQSLSVAGARPKEKTPKVAKEVSKPTLTTLNAQLKELLKVATGIEDIEHDQQKTQIAQAEKAEDASQENRLESPNLPGGPDAVPETGDGTGEDIGPLKDSLDGFAEALDSLIEKISLISGKSTQDQDGGGLGLRDMASMASMADTALSAGRSLSGLGRKGLDAVKAGGANLAGRAGRSADVARAALTRAVRTGKASAAGRVTKAAIKKLALPILAKGVGKTVLKSIPLLGAAAGVGFAIGRLLEGDVVGAGLEAVSGLGSAATAIPAFIASTARDIYSSVYGVQPEADPQAGERLAYITGIVKEAASEIMKPQVERKERPASSSSRPQASSRPPTPQQQATPSAPPAPPTPPSTPSASPTSTGGAGGAPAAEPTAPAERVAAPPAAPTAPQRPPQQNNQANIDRQLEAQTSNASVASTPDFSSSYAAAGGAQLGSDGLYHREDPTQGERLIRQSERNEMSMLSPYDGSILDSVRVGTPSRLPTTKSGYVGTGNVPDPTYYGAGAIDRTLYFGAYAGMAA